MHEIKLYLIQIPLLEYLFQNKISKSVMIFTQLADFFTTKQLARCIIESCIMKCKRLSHFSERLVLLWKLDVTDDSDGEHFLFHKLATTDYDCYSFI